MGSGAEEKGARIEKTAKSISGFDTGLWVLLWTAGVGTLYARAGLAYGAATVPS